MASKPSRSDDHDWGFEWPPKEKILPSEMFELDGTSARRTNAERTDAEPASFPAEMPDTPLAEFAAEPDVQAQPPVRWPQPPPRSEPLEASMHVQEATLTPPAAAREDWRQLDRELWGPIAIEDQSRRAWAVPTALVALSLIAILEGVFILRTRTQQSSGNSAGVAPRALPQESPRTTVAPTSGLVATAPVSGANRVTGKADLANGRLIIRSEPTGAHITIDGRSYGVTPTTLENISAGEHRILLKRGTLEARQRVRVEAGRTVSVVAPLQSTAPAGWVAITSPVDVDVFERGTLLGTSRSPRIMLREGAHTLELVNATVGYREEQQVQIAPGKVTPVSVTLPQGILHVNATPWADVWIDGKSVGQTPIGNLAIAIGPHDVVFRHPELGEKTVSTFVKPGVPTRVSADLRPR